MQRNKLKYILILFVFALVISSCSSNTSEIAQEEPEDDPVVEEPTRLIVATNAGPVDLDPHGTTDQNTYDVRFQIYESLVKVGPDGEVEPLLATNWNWVDPTTLHLTLRENVQFQNGSEFTGEDVLYTLRRASTSNFTASYIDTIIIDESSVLEDGTLELKLNTPLSSLLTRLALVVIIDQETWESEGEEKMLEQPIGTGPYKFIEWVEGDRIEFEAFEDYWGEDPYYEQLVMRIIPESASRALEIEAGTVDVAIAIQASDVELLEEDPNVELYSTPSYMITYLGFDTNVAPYDNVKVRQALSYAIDREAITEVVYAGLGTPASYGRLSEVYWGYTEEGLTEYTYDPEKAKQLLEEAGYPDGFDMTLTLSEAEQDQVLMSEIIQNQFNEIGVNVEIDIMENASFLNLIVEGGFDAFLLNSVGNSSDPGEALKSFIATRPTWSNTTRYQNAELTALIEKGQQTIDEEEKREIFYEVQEIVNEEVPWVFIVHNRIAFAARSEVKGLVAYPSSMHFYKEAFE